MLKIAYGVQGTGNGHITRARAMASAFNQREDVQVDYFFSGRAPEKYFDMECFGAYQTYSGLSFVCKRGQVAKWQTVKTQQYRQFLRDLMSLDLRQYDLVINDFEPLTAWVAKRQGVPSLSISHQAAFSLGAPTAGTNIIDNMVMRFFAPTDIQLGVHWFHFGKAILPPIIVEQPVDNPTADKTLVYLPFESVEDVNAMLEPLSEHPFICFHPDVQTSHQREHIEWHPTSQKAFKKALVNTSGVIANAGFELSSEALRLGKKLLLKPLSGQFEQLSNAETLRELNLCDTMYILDTDSVEDWLSMENIEPITFPSNSHILIDWLVERNWDQTDQVCQQLWRQVKFPDRMRQQLMRLAI